MPYNILALIIIIIAFAVIVFVVIRKFPQIANLDIEELPEEKTAKKKNKILEERFMRVFVEKTKKLKTVAAPLGGYWGKAQENFRHLVAQSKVKVIEAARERKKQIAAATKTAVPIKKKILATVGPAEQSDQIESLISSADAFFEEGRFSDAEHKYLDAIKLDQKNVAAYRGLGKVYMKNGSYKEAKELFTFILHLTPKDDTLYIKLAKTSEMQNDYLSAKDYYKKALAMNSLMPIRQFEYGQVLEELKEYKESLRAIAKAVELEPTNPRYLDGFININIIVGDRASAEAVFDKLRLVNPENKKLTEFRQRIDAMDSPARGSTK